MSEDEGVVEKQAEPEKVAFHYIKTTDYHPIHVDGVIGGLTPKGLIHAAVFTEHAPIPQKTVQRIQDGVVGDEITDERVVRDGIVRDVAASLIMTPEMAQKLVEWLQSHLTKLAKVQEKFANAQERSPE
jgi:hypothetical protein